MTRSRTHGIIVFALLVSISVAAVTPAAAQFGKNKIQYRDFDWKIYHSPHFDVYYYEEEKHLLEKVVSFAESAYDNLSREFDFQIKEPTPLIFYATHSAFEQNNIILNFIPEGTGAFASPVRNRMVLPVDLPDPELMELILHELTHIFQYHILFQGRLGRGVAASPPLWFMEGMASYMAKDESARDKMYLRDAVVNDRIPSVAQNFSGFFAYRFGHAVFDFIEERWGKEGYLDFVVETRNTLGGQIPRAIQRTFNMSVEDFDAEFRRWLRKRYLEELLRTGEPTDFGRRFRDAGAGTSVSPVSSPSGDLVAAFSTGKGQVDLVIFDAHRRVLLKNLTKGYNRSVFQYVVAQELTMGREDGRDITWSPDGNFVAGFAKKESGRALVIVDVIKGKIREVIELETEQELAPVWSPDGEEIAFSANLNGKFDIFTYHVESGDLTNLTDDELYHRSVDYSPDGKQLVLTTSVGGLSKLFLMNLDDSSRRFQVTFDDTNEFDPVFSGDGKRIFYTSDLTGANNIFELELATGAVRQHTNAVTGCFQPTVLTAPDGKERLVFTAFWKGGFDLYLLDIEEPISDPLLVSEPSEEPFVPEEVELAELPRFEPAIEVAIDEDNESPYKGRKFFLENFSGSGIGVSDDQTLVASIALSFSDYLGDRRIYGSFSSIDSFSNFDIIYANLSRRLQWNVHLFDNRDFFVGFDPQTGETRTNQLFRLTGVTANISYPFTFYHRAEAGVGYIDREIGGSVFFRDPITGEPVPGVQPTKDDFPVINASFVGDTTIFTSFGPVSGRRYRLFGSYAPDLDDSGAVTQTLGLEWREYIPTSRRTGFAFRFWGADNDGNNPNLVYIGGMDTIRGFDFRSIVGNSGFYSNFEWRFPMIDFMATPLGVIRDLRGFFFLDVGGAWFRDESFKFWNSDENRLEDAVSSYGWGFSVRFFGLPFNFAFAKKWDFDTSEGSFESSFWIGMRF